MKYDLKINGETRSVEADPDTPMLWVIRDELDMTGTKFGCGVASCGACTIHVDGEPTRSCQTTIEDAVGSEITTIEGLNDKVAMAVQTAWCEKDVVEFSRELTTSVMWLNDFGLDIRCVRMQPYDSDGETLLDVQTVIPIPEATDYQVRIREKKQKEREARNSSRDFTKYDVSVGGKNYPAQSKRWIIFHIIAEILRSGGQPDTVINAIHWRRNDLFQVFDGELNDSEVYEAIMEGDSGGRVPRAERFFTKEGQAFYSNGKTYVLTNQWGDKTLEAVESLRKAFPDLNIRISKAGAD